MPEQLHDRAQDNWEALVAIADAAGGGWRVRARDAALALSAAAASDTDGEALGIQLLADIREALARHGMERVSMRQLVDALVAMEDRPWATIQRGKALDAHGLGRRLRPFGVRARPIRSDGARVEKGYRARDFADAFARYPAPSADPVTAPEPQAEIRNPTGLRYPHVTGGQLRESTNDAARVTDPGCEARERVAL